MDEFEIENARRLEYDRQRERERQGISGAAEAGVFTPGRPKELDLVAKRDAWLEQQWANEFRPQDHSVPVSAEDGPFDPGPAVQQRVAMHAKDWGAEMQTQAEEGGK